MSYQILARKYRPQSFDEVLGQEACVQTLRNAILHGRIHQAYLFCGARGVGKTSLARIFSKSLNCEKGPSAQPCQSCPSCIDITQSRSLDVLEIDGASNTGVDSVRELREQAKFLPSSGRYKIYIIDEVHMLSTSAFNALLKILEEPPSHLIFIFATTEAHKIPVTILSRCQRFDFKRLTANQLVSHLKKTLERENMQMKDECLNLIAQVSEGSVRDSLSLLDQTISYCGDHVEVTQVREMLGLTARGLVDDLLQAILASHHREVLRQAQILWDNGTDLKIFSEGLMERIRHLVVLAQGEGDLVDLSPDEKNRLKTMASREDSPYYLMLFQILSKGVEEISRSNFPRFVFETTLLKMIEARGLLSISDLIKTLEDGSPVTSPRSGVQEDSVPKRKDIWTDFVGWVLKKRPQLGSVLEHACCLEMDQGKIVLGFQSGSVYADMLKDQWASLGSLAQAFFEKALTFDLRELNEASPLVRSVLEIREEDERRTEAKKKEEALLNPMIQRAQEILGARVKEVKSLK